MIVGVNQVGLKYIHVDTSYVWIDFQILINNFHDPQLEELLHNQVPQYYIYEKCMGHRN